MYLKKLEIVGFKSFGNKTTLHFEPGIAAIVGPNGCGKSNIFDSIRWVLGEQSAKSLRGSDMQDVIFNGTDTKEPLGMAEVTLTFDNSQRFFPVEYPEVAVTRRIFRSGESEYLLNKAQVRLKDILDLMMGTGIGAESYSLVEQGKIDLVLSSKPEDRRLVFDEASGITKYKSQKREALRKLDETEQNLLRVNDIITEVRRQIGSLERQANKARRYKEAFEELKVKEIDLVGIQKKHLLAEKDEIIKQLSELETKEVELLKIIQEQEAKISNRQSELRALEESVMGIKNEIMDLSNSTVRDKQHIDFNQEKIAEFNQTRLYLETQIEQTKGRVALDEEKLNNLRREYDAIKANTEEKNAFLQEKEAELSTLSLAIKNSLDNISSAKRNILDLVTRTANTKNDISDLASKEQIYLARKKRLQLERAKVGEEKATVTQNFDAISQEIEKLNQEYEGSNVKYSSLKVDLEEQNLLLGQISLDISNLEKESLSLQSQKEFLETLRHKYEDISESMNAVIYLDKLPAEGINGLVVKIKSQDEGLKFSGEAKPIDLDAQKIISRIQSIEEKILAFKEDKSGKENRIQALSAEILQLQENIHAQEIVLSNKKAFQNTVQEDLNKLQEEDQIITLELSDVETELGTLATRLTALNQELGLLENQNKEQELIINSEQGNISLNTGLKEMALVAVAQAKTELDALVKRVSSEEVTLKILQDSYAQDQASLLNLENQIKDSHDKQQLLESEIKELEAKISRVNAEIEIKNILLKEEDSKYKEISSGSTDWMKSIETNRNELDALKTRLYELQMQDKDIDFKYLSIKERIAQAYKIDFDTLQESGQVIDETAVSGQIQALKEKLDSYGNVNLVAIEEYDELKKRYDFLTQQQGDLTSAKDSLHEAILKINRTTKKMFLETFEKVRVEFRNYFKLLFNGGDAQLFLIDEQDPLESGIEIICRPPGKKLQNVLLLSGGEKSMSATALIFAIFKVKPAPFCVLDEIDAALDEANVDRFGRMLQEFTSQSQFIVITHNKKTIASAGVMYGITMEESGVSKIVSVKFAQNKPEIETAVA